MTVLLSLAVLAAAFALLEAGARLCGLGRPLLYEKTAYGYRVVPGQSISRFGHRVYYNSEGMRSEPMDPNVPPGVVRVLCIGDSITFGGTAVDQERTYPYQLQAYLNARLDAVRYEVLNVSAGGWALENEEGWLTAHGVYGSRVLILQVATHDLFQDKSGSEVVGRHPSFPERPPVLALQELLLRYVLPYLSARLRLRDPGEVLYHHTREDVARNMAILARIHRMAEAAHAQLFVLFVEQPRGHEPVDELTQYGKAVFYTKTAEWGIPVIRPARAMELAGGAMAFFDGMHPNAVGNEVLAKEVGSAIAKWRQTQAPFPARGRVVAIR